MYLKRNVKQLSQIWPDIPWISRFRNRAQLFMIKATVESVYCTILQVSLLRGRPRPSSWDLSVERTLPWRLIAMAFEMETASFGFEVLSLAAAFGAGSYLCWVLQCCLIFHSRENCWVQFGQVYIGLNSVTISYCQLLLLIVWFSESYLNEKTCVRYPVDYARN